MSLLRSVEIEEVDYVSFTDADIAILNDFENISKDEARPEDPPTPVERTRAFVHNIPSHIVFREFWIRDDEGGIAALAYVLWRNTDDNRHIVNVDVSVRAEYRRRGIARILLERLAEVTKGEGRTMLAGFTTDRVPAGEAFARQLGAEAAQAVHTNRLLISDVDPGLVRAWIDDGQVRAPGYSLAAVDGPFPDDIVENAVEAYDIMNTAPRGDLAFEDALLTVEQMRDIEKRGVAEGSERWVLFAQHDGTGRFVGLTEMFWNPSSPKIAHQGDTGVHPEHRGHALGKWIKAAMLERVMREWPTVEEVRTGNADSNEAMLGINNALGFKPYIASMNWQVRLERVEAYLAGSSV